MADTERAETYLRELAESELGSWSSGGVNIFGANVVPAVPPSISAVDVLVISRTADARASAPLTWWTS